MVRLEWDALLAQSQALFTAAPGKVRAARCRGRRPSVPSHPRLPLPTPSPHSLPPCPAITQVRLLTKYSHAKGSFSVKVTDGSQVRARIAAGRRGGGTG